MALRIPTLRQRRLGAELRRMREQAGFGGSHLARLLGVTPALVSQMEIGKSAVSVARLHEIAEACMCANAPLVEALADMARERDSAWWDEYRTTLAAAPIDVAEIEGRAKRLKSFTIGIIPGLLQTNSYATAVFATGFTPLPEREVDRRVKFRLRRQQIIQAGETPYTALVHEAALRIQYGGPTVLREQLESLIRDSERPAVSLRVVPFATANFPGPSENLLYAEGPVPELDTVQADSSHGSHIFDSPAQLAGYRATLERIEAVALQESESRDHIRSIMKEMNDRHE
ncbi:helix-turn-helix transcriptional regulator [Kitasatospora sp. Ki12]|uniref:helix-turn-helix domain-containing protein n=1 Tax=Kitasatospora xanthocidica TaxID=83382 RepID=UPI00167B2AAA|nr:helix-turn-helix transcriptional regulator [Kitasatospora xanthocidica]GHF49435.1 transcriptional regulator [Kitasatospora xanthocidica]